MFAGVPLCNGGSFVCLWFFLENRRMNSSVLDVYSSVEEIYGCVGNFASEFIDGCWLLRLEMNPLN